MQYIEWERAVAAFVAGALGISNRDAQASVEAQPFTLQQSWGRGLEAEQAGAKILAAGQVQEQA